MSSHFECQSNQFNDEKKNVFHEYEMQGLCRVHQDVLISSWVHKILSSILMQPVSGTNFRRFVVFPKHRRDILSFHFLFSLNTNPSHSHMHTLYFSSVSIIITMAFVSFFH